MQDFVYQFQHEAGVTVVFQVELEKVMTIGDALQAIHEYAYMNGYNWDAVLGHYLEKYHPELTNGLGRDPEAGSLAMYYPLGAEYVERAQYLEQVIRDLLNDKERLYAFVREEGDHIPWD